MAFDPTANTSANSLAETIPFKQYSHNINLFHEIMRKLANAIKTYITITR